MPRRDMVQTFGRKKNAVAVATCSAKVEGKARGEIRINGVPINIYGDRMMRVKLCTGTVQRSAVTRSFGDCALSPGELPRC